METPTFDTKEVDACIELLDQLIEQGPPWAQRRAQWVKFNWQSYCQGGTTADELDHQLESVADQQYIPQHSEEDQLDMIKLLTAISGLLRQL